MSGGTGITETLDWPQFGGAASTPRPTSPPLPERPIPPVPTTTVPPVPTRPPLPLLPALPPLPTFVPASIPPAPLVDDDPAVPSLNPQPARKLATKQATKKPGTCPPPRRIDRPPRPLGLLRSSVQPSLPRSRRLSGNLTQIHRPRTAQFDHKKGAKQHAARVLGSSRRWRSRTPGTTNHRGCRRG